MELAMFQGVSVDGTDENLFNYGEGSQSDLIKALQANEGVTDIANLYGGQALQKQSLEGQLASLTFSEKHLVFYKAVPKSKAWSTVEEYSILQNVGTEGGFVGQMENPPQGDPDLKRAFSVVKYLRTHCRVGDVLETTDKIVSAVNVATSTGILRLLRVAEQKMFFGDDSIISYDIKGLLKQVIDGAPSNIIDIRGRDITESDFKLGAEIIANAFGMAGACFMSNGVKTRLDNIYGTPGAGQTLFQPNAGAGKGVVRMGYTVEGVNTGFGYVPYTPDVFLNVEKLGVPQIFINGVYQEGATSQQAPATPSMVLAAEAAGYPGGVTSLWTADLGAHKYRVVAVNQYGFSQACVAASATVGALGRVKITITSGGGAYPPLAYRIYRETAVGSNNIQLMTTVVASQGGPTIAYDYNNDIPGTSYVFLLDMNTQGEDELRTMSLKQLAPLHKTPLAKIGPFTQWLQNLYMTFAVYAPTKQIIFKNVKSSSF